MLTPSQSTVIRFPGSVSSAAAQQGHNPCPPYTEALPGHSPPLGAPIAYFFVFVFVFFLFFSFLFTAICEQLTWTGVNRTLFWGGLFWGYGPGSGGM